MVTTGLVTLFPLPTPNSQVFFITTGQDGNIWFAEFGAAKIGRITTSGVITEFLLPGAAQVITGPDGALWVAQQTSAGEGRIARLVLP